MIDLKRQHWQDMWYDIRAEPPKGLLCTLINAYSQPHRYYHTLQHIDECFSLLQNVYDFAERPAEVALAIWFHDYVYAPRETDNEERSAKWAEITILGSSAKAEVAERVKDLVLATKHDSPLIGGDAKLLVDIDLAILGATDERFEEYEKQIRQEYSWVPEDKYRKARRDILLGFLDREFIYSTSYFSYKYEEKARANLTRAVIKSINKW